MMRSTVTMVFAALLALSGPAHAQQLAFKGASPEAKQANQHYRNAWDAMHTESWDEAAKEFRAAIESDDKFALAYYGLGRAEMGRKNFPKAIAAYNDCKALYVRLGGERYTNQMDYKRRVEDQMLEYQTALQQAQQVSSGKATSQSQQLYVTELRTKLQQLQQAKDRTDSNVTIDIRIPYFVPMSLGAAYFRNGAFANAETEYKAALEANPGSGETHNNLAVLYLTTGRLTEAEAEVKAAEKTGFKVNENLKSDIIQSKRRGGS
jgi:tetratricopeptide (TPR) repeat protein